MNPIVLSSITRYHEKTAGNFIVDWLKKHIKLPSKDKALKVLKKHIKDEKDVDELYAYLPKIQEFLKGKKAKVDINIKENLDPSQEPIFPKNFIKNLAVLCALIAILGGAFPSNSDKAKELLIKEKIIKTTEVFRDIGYFRLSDTIKDKITKKDTQEEMHEKVYLVLKEKKYLLRSEYNKKFLSGTKDPLSFRLSKDKEGKQLFDAEDLLNHEGVVYIQAIL